MSGLKLADIFIAPIVVIGMIAGRIKYLYCDARQIGYKRQAEYMDKRVAEFSEWLTEKEKK
jgi:hypothetical protein